MTYQFGSTKPDQAGETTCEVKRMFANPFRPEICIVFTLAIYIWCKRRSKSIYIKNYY